MIDILLSASDLALIEGLAAKRGRVRVTGEVAVAIALGKLGEWDPEGRGDVYGWQVGATPAWDGPLPLDADCDDPEGRYVLVVGEPPWVRVAGWCYGRWGMEGRYLLEGSRYLVPQEKLVPFSGYTIKTKERDEQPTSAQGPGPATAAPT